MIQPLFALVFAEVVVILTLLFRTPLRNPLVMLLDKMKQGRVPVIVQTVGATLFMILISILYNVAKIQKRSTDSGTISSTEEVLLINHLLEACLLGKFFYSPIKWLFQGKL
jgi:B-cell receptor-associated protein 31